MTKTPTENARERTKDIGQTKGARKRERMKIDESCINHNAVRLINEIVGSLYEYGDQDETADHSRLLTLGAVRGVLNMAEAMKEVLKV